MAAAAPVRSRTRRTTKRYDTRNITDFIVSTGDTACESASLVYEAAEARHQSTKSQWQVGINFCTTSIQSNMQHADALMRPC